MSIKLSTTSVGLAVTPTVVSTLFSHYLNRQPLRERPTAHLSYDEGLHLVRSFLLFASQHTVEELQAFTSQWVPHPQWVKVETVTIPQQHIDMAAQLLYQQLGEDGIQQVGGREWWQWRKPKSDLAAEWIEMKADANERKRKGDPGKRVMMYIHGGAYFFGSVDEHRYQMQRHARKLKARVFAPKYRLAPQFPFPCGLQDCVAAYLHLLTVQDPSEIVLAGDSAGGGMVLSVLCILRDQNIPLPAGAILISPWVDLTHSFPSVGEPAPMDYIPQSGFHHKPSKSWPPPNEDDTHMLRREAQKLKKGSSGSKGAGTQELEEKQQDPVAPVNGVPPSNEAPMESVSGGVVTNTEEFLSVTIDGELVRIKDQIQMYTTNNLLSHPLVSPIMQPTLGGLPPLLIMVGGGEMLRDEQIYVAHKCADPTRYAPPPEKLDDNGKEMLAKYKPTDVQLQVWEDLCHVAPTLSFTRPAKYMYRSVAQFGAWALARAQKRGIEIMDDDAISVISDSASTTEAGGSEGGEVQEPDRKKNEERDQARELQHQKSISEGVGKAGDPLPPFKDHMIRQRVTRHGASHPLAPESELPACTQKVQGIGVIKEGQVKKWLAAKHQWDSRFATTKAKVHKKIIKDMAHGYHDFPGENPPPTALAGRRRLGEKFEEKKRIKSLGLALWSAWGSKHDEATVEREIKANEAHHEPETNVASPTDGQHARSVSDTLTRPPPSPHDDRSPSRSRVVTDENQTDENTPIAELMAKRQETETASDLLNVPATGTTGKRPFVEGIAMPFTLKKEAETASMLTLNSAMSPGTRPQSPQANEPNGTIPGSQGDASSPTINHATQSQQTEGTPNGKTSTVNGHLGPDNTSTHVSS